MNISKIVRSAKCGVLGALVAMGMSAVAEPTVTVGEVKSGEPWSKITVNYTLGGVDAATDYKVAFDVTAGGQTASVTNDATKLENKQYSQELDTASAALFGKEVTDTKAKVKVSLIAIKPKADLGGVQLWEGGPIFAECNVGADKPEEYGYYFWWGDTVGYTNTVGKTSGSGTWLPVENGTTSIQFSSTDATANQTCQKNAATLKSLGYIDDEADPVLNAAHDAATAHLGAPWRMMTEAELDKLVDTAYCTRTWVTSYNGKSVNGYVVKGANDPYKNNEVFFPAAGRGNGSSLNDSGSFGSYWSSTPGVVFISAWGLDFYSSHFDAVGDDNRYGGFPVRAVRGSAE